MPTATEILNQFYADERTFMAQAPEEQDRKLLANTLASNIKLHQTPGLPYGGLYEGIDEFLVWGKTMGSLFSKVDVQPSNILERAADVVVISTVHSTIRKTQRDLSFPFLQHVKVDAEMGKITEIWPFYWNVKGLVEALEEQV